MSTNDSYVLAVIDELISFEERHAECEPRANFQARECRMVLEELRREIGLLLDNGPQNRAVRAVYEDRVRVALARFDGSVTNRELVRNDDHLQPQPAAAVLAETAQDVPVPAAGTDEAQPLAVDLGFVEGHGGVAAGAGPHGATVAPKFYILTALSNLLDFAKRGVESDDPMRECIQAGFEALGAVAGLIEADKKLDACSWFDADPCDSDDLAAAKQAKRAALTRCGVQS